MITSSAALIAASSALVAAAVSFAGFLISKDLKTTEFRQAWINDQRADFATVIAEAATLLRCNSKRATEASLASFDLAAARIGLRENPRKPEWEDQIRLIAETRALLLAGLATSETVERNATMLVKGTQDRLKAEWDRVRAGEETYQKARKLAMWVGLCSIATIIILFMAIGYGKGFIVLGRV